MAQLYKKSTGFGRSILACGAVVASFLFACPAILDAKTPVVRQDPEGDVRLLRTDDECHSPFDAEAHRLPDILETRLGTFQPYCPSSNLFYGTWSVNGGFMRLDVVFDGLINPPGLVGMSDFGEFLPYKYGPNPVFGFIELDVDANENTGGEIEFPELRYLGNVSRMGGLPQVAHYSNRVAISSQVDFDDYVPSAPFVDRGGEEFHLSLVGDEIDSFSVLVESDCGDPERFEEGETWHLSGHWLHRAHSFEEFSLQCFSAEGRYMPVSVLQFRHSNYSNRTTVSLVFPLRNTAYADMQSPSEPVQPNNGCPGDQFSIEEGLEDLRFSAFNADPIQMLEDEFPLIAEWALQLPAASLNPAQWRINACLGSAYPAAQSGNARFVWTDMYPNVVNADFNADGLVTIMDVQLLQAYISEHDGHSDYDCDEDSSNHSIKLDDFSRNFCLFDSNYDGYVNANDMTRLGDMDWDGEVGCEDIDDLALGLLDPAEYAVVHPGKLPEKHGDLDGNFILDGRDIQIFVHYLLSQP